MKARPNPTHTALDESGFTLVEMTIVLAIIGILASVAVPILLDARKRGNEANAVVALRLLHTAQSVFEQRDKDRDGQADYAANLTELYDADKLIDGVLASGTMQGYTFEILPGPANLTWSANANPIHPGRSGDRYYWIDQSGVIRFSTTQPAGPTDQAVGN